MRVLWLTFIPSPYRLRFFEELGKQCDLTVLFERESSKNRKSHWDNFSFNGYKGIILKGVTVGGFDKFCPGVSRYLNRKYDIIVISDPTSPTGIYAAAILQKKKIPYIVESDGAFPTHGKGIKMALKKFVMSNAALCLSTAKLHDEYYIECGVKPENIRRYPFTSIGKDDILKVKELTALDKQYFEDESLQDKMCKANISKAEEYTVGNKIENCISLLSEQREINHRELIREAARARLNIKETKMVLSIGQFIPRKGFDILLKAAQNVQTDVGFYIIGGTPDEEYLALAEKADAKRIHFLEFMDKAGLEDYFRAADLFVLLTKEDVWGLVINEAMAYGLPVITTDKCIAGLEMVQDDINGYIVSTDDVKNLTSKIVNLINDKTLCTKMCENNILKIEEYTFENMAAKHITLFNEL